LLTIGVAMANIDDEIRAYEQMRDTLEQHHLGKFVVIRDGVLVGAFDTIETAAKEAAQKFGGGPYLIRQVGAPTTIPMPSSLAHFSQHAAP
jgi:hypothetical protein